MKLYYSAAAVVLLLLGLSLFMKFYTQTVFSKPGEHITHLLPDGSVVELNADTKLEYHPYWWSISRTAELEGEAFFEAEHGSKFTVYSKNGTTEVIGTEFNIFASGNNYDVFCKSGKVKVKSTETDIKFIIKAGQAAHIDNTRKEGKKFDANAEDIVYWKENKFNFKNETLKNVFEELEKQYGVSIKYDPEIEINSTYTGYFKKAEKVEQSLNLICKSFNFTFVKVKEKQYKVIQK